MERAEQIHASRASLSVRLINIDHCLVERGRLDRKYCQFHPPGVPFDRVPVIRIFGSTEAGQRVCVHVHQAFPYLYVPYVGDLDPMSVQMYIQQLGTSLNHAVGRVLKRNTADPSDNQFVAAIVLVKGVPFYGYHVGWEHFLKIYLVDPATRYAVVQVLQQGGVMGLRLQPHEAHIPFEMQFMIDHNLYGMGMMDISDLLFRTPFNDKPPGRMYTAGRLVYTELTVPEEHVWPEYCAPPREAHSELECDILASNIMNRYLIQERNLHHDWSESFKPQAPVKLVTSLAALWEDEARRMRVLNKPSPPTQKQADPSRPPPGVPPTPWAAEERLHEIMETLVREDAPNAAAIAAKFGFPARPDNMIPSSPPDNVEPQHPTSTNSSVDEPRILTAFQATCALYPRPSSENWEPALSQMEATEPEDGVDADQTFEDGPKSSSRALPAGSVAVSREQSQAASFTMVVDEEAIQATQRAIELANSPDGINEESSDEIEQLEDRKLAEEALSKAVDEAGGAGQEANSQDPANPAEMPFPDRWQISNSYSEDAAFLREHVAELSSYAPTPLQQDTQPNVTSSQAADEAHHVLSASSMPSSPVISQRQKAHGLWVGSRTTSRPVLPTEAQLAMQSHLIEEQQDAPMNERIRDPPSDDPGTPLLLTGNSDIPSSPGSIPKRGLTIAGFSDQEAKRRRSTRIPQYDGAGDEDGFVEPSADPPLVRRRKALVLLPASRAVVAKRLDGCSVPARRIEAQSATAADRSLLQKDSKPDVDQGRRRQFQESSIELSPLGMRLRSRTSAAFGKNSSQSRNRAQCSSRSPADRSVVQNSSEDELVYPCGKSRPEKSGQMISVPKSSNPQRFQLNAKRMTRKKVAFVEIEVTSKKRSQAPSNVASPSSRSPVPKVTPAEEKVSRNLSSCAMTSTRRCGPCILVPSSPPPFRSTGQSSNASSGAVGKLNGRHGVSRSLEDSGALCTGETDSGSVDGIKGRLPRFPGRLEPVCRPPPEKWLEKLPGEELAEGNGVLVLSSQVVLRGDAMRPASGIQPGNRDEAIGQKLAQVSGEKQMSNLVSYPRLMRRAAADHFQLVRPPDAKVASEVGVGDEIVDDSCRTAGLYQSALPLATKRIPNCRKLLKRDYPPLMLRADRDCNRSNVGQPLPFPRTDGNARRTPSTGVEVMRAKLPRHKEVPRMSDGDEAVSDSRLIPEFREMASGPSSRTLSGLLSQTAKPGGARSGPQVANPVAGNSENEQRAADTTSIEFLLVGAEPLGFPGSMDGSLRSQDFPTENDLDGPNGDAGYFDPAPPLSTSSDPISSGTLLGGPGGGADSKATNDGLSEQHSARASPPREGTVDVCLERGSDHMFRYRRSPPTPEELAATLKIYGMPPVLYREPYYSDPRDVPRHPKEYAGKVFNVVSDTVAHLPEFCADEYVRKVREAEGGRLLEEGRAKESRSYQSWLNALLGLQSESLISHIWTRCAPPPTRAEVVRWLEQQNHLQQEGTDDYVDEVDDASGVLKRRKSVMKTVSQLEGPTPANAYGFKFSQHTTDAISMEEQHLGVLSLEIFVSTRGSLQPNPDDDPLVALFICWFSDVEDDCTNGDRPGYRVVIITTDAARVHSIGILGFEIKICRDEKEMLLELISRVRHLDPDILTGFEIHNSSWGYVIQRASFIYGINIADELSRISSPFNVQPRREGDTWGYRKASAVHILGRHMLNTWRLIRSELNLTSYTYENVVFHVLHERVPKFSHQTLTSWFQHGSAVMRRKVFTYMIERAQGNMKILDDTEVITRACEFARVFGIDFYAVISRGSQFKVESFMFRLAKPENFILMSPSKTQVKEQRALECLPLVMEPMSALYTSPVCVLDFQSLYPSVIIAYNYCYSTCLGRLAEGPSRKKLGVRDDFELQPGVLALLKDYVNIAPNGLVFVKETIRKSLLSKMLEELLDTRMMIKNAMKEHKHDKALLKVLNARQLSLKYIANVTYGYTSASFSGRMPCADIADAIVQTGRETNEKAISMVNAHPDWDACVRYGDTDSMFVHLDGQSRKRAFEIGRMISDAITSLNPPPVALKFEKVYHPCVLLAKKRYVGNMFESGPDADPEFEAKGIEVIRRDGCPAVQKLQEASLKLLFRTQNLSEIKAYLQRQFEKILDGRISLQDFLFANEIKDLNNYTNLPAGAVVCLKKMAEDPRSEPQYKERIPYLIAHGPPNERLRDLAVSPEDFLNNRHMRLNGLYYINKAIIPPLARILNIVGADVQAWFEKMPRTYRATRYVANEEGRAPGRRTIDHFYHSCLVCRELTSSVLCARCESQPQEALLLMAQTVAKRERRLNALLDVCSSCSALPRIPDVPCISLDCPVYYERAKARNLTQLAMEEEDRVLAVWRQKPETAAGDPLHTC